MVDQNPTNYNYTYNGYYYEGDYDETSNYYNLLKTSKNFVPYTDPILPKQGDYLLLNNTTNLSLFKYINNDDNSDNKSFINIELPNYFIYYSYTSYNYYNSEGSFYKQSILFVNKILSSVSISSYDNGTFELTTEFSGVGNIINKIPEANSNNKYIFFMDINKTNTDNLLFYQCYNIGNNYQFIPVFTCLSKFTFITTNIISNINIFKDIYVIYIELDSQDCGIFKINFNTSEYMGYQGFYCESVDNVNNLEDDIINKIVELKLNRQIVLNDTLLTKYNGGNYTIYIVNNINNKSVISINIEDDILFNNLLDLTILKIDTSNNVEIINGYFDQYNIIFDCDYLNQPMELEINYSNLLNDGYVYYLYNKILLYRINISYIEIFTGLFKLNINTTDNDSFLCYLLYDVDCYYLKMINTQYNSNIYNGFYNINLIDIPNNILSSLNIIKDKIDLYVGNIFLSMTNDGQVFTSSLSITYNNLELINKIVEQDEIYTFLASNLSPPPESLRNQLNIDLVRDPRYPQILSYLVTYNSITSTFINPIDSPVLFGIIGKTSPTITYNEMDSQSKIDGKITGKFGVLPALNLYPYYLNFKNGIIYQYIDNNIKWVELKTNNDLITFKNDVYEFIISKFNDEITITNNTPEPALEPKIESYTYNGYYYKGDVGEQPDYYSLLNIAKNNAHGVKLFLSDSWGGDIGD